MIGITPAISGADLTPKNHRLQIDLEHRLNRWFQETANHIGDVIRSKYEPGQLSTRKADDLDDSSDPEGEDLQTELLVGGKKIPKVQSDLIRALALLGWGAIKWREMVLFVEPYLEAAAQEGIDVGVGQVQMVSPAKAQAAAEEDAEAYAARRAAELAGMKWVEVPKDAPGAMEHHGVFVDLVEDPNAHWPLTDVMRRDMDASIEQAVTEGWTADQLAAVIEASYALSAERSTIIAETEMTNAQSAGTYSLWRRSGSVTLVHWTTHGIDREPDECDRYEAQGVVPLGHEFDEGLFSPRAHPFCRCSLEVVNPSETMGTS